MIQQIINDAKAMEAETIRSEVDAHNTRSCSVLLVGLEAWRWWGTSWLLLLHERSLGLLVIKALQHVQCCSQELLCGTLISNRHLKFLVLLLAVFSCALELHLHLSNLCLQLIDGF